MLQSTVCNTGAISAQINRKMRTQQKQQSKRFKLLSIWLKKMYNADLKYYQDLKGF